MWSIISSIVSGLGTNAIESYFDYKIRRADSEVAILKIEADKKKNVEMWQARSEVLRHGSFWFQLIFIIPLGLWWSGVLLYSLLWCEKCAYPFAGLGYYWEIAALPEPLNSWGGAIIAFLFLTEAFKKR